MGKMEIYRESVMKTRKGVLLVLLVLVLPIANICIHVMPVKNTGGLRHHSPSYGLKMI